MRDTERSEEGREILGLLVTGYLNIVLNIKIQKPEKIKS